MKKYYNIIIALVLFASCSDMIEVDPGFKQKLVVSGILKAGDTISIYLYKNLAISDQLVNYSDNIFENGVGDAFITLYENNVLCDTLILWKYESMYSSKTVAREGHTYQLMVNHPDYGTVSANTEIPDSVPVRSVNYQVSTDSANMRISAGLLDKVGIGNYYAMRLYKWKNGRKQSRAFYNVDPLHGGALNFDFNTLGLSVDYESAHRLDFSDENNDGDTLSVQLLLPLKFEGVGAVNNIYKGDTLVVNLITLHEEIYQLNESTKLYGQAQSSGAQPTSIYSNIVNGLGIFSGYSSHDYLFVYE